MTFQSFVKGLTRIFCDPTMPTVKIIENYPPPPSNSPVASPPRRIPTGKPTAHNWGTGHVLQEKPKPSDYYFISNEYGEYLISRQAPLIWDEEKSDKIIKFNSVTEMNNFLKINNIPDKNIKRHYYCEIQHLTIIIAS